MPHPFSPTHIKFGGYGKDDAGSVWLRVWLGSPSSRSVIVRLADLNVGSPELWRRIGDAGILLSPTAKKIILEKLQHMPRLDNRFRVVSAPGWSSGYVTPTKVFGAPSFVVEREFSGLTLSKYRSAGTLNQWQNEVLVLCTGNSRLMFSIICAFAGPLLEILGIGSFGFQLFGPSSIGKTIVLIVGGSVWGCRVGASSHLGFLATWATTQEGVELYGRAHNDAFLALDETRLAGSDRDMGKLVATFIMRLAEGVSKNRLVPAGAGGDWRLVYLGSSNLSLIQMFLAAGLEFDDAYRARFPDIPADVGCGYGAFEDIHDFPNAAAFAKELHARACTYFGIASEHYLERLAKDHERGDWLASRVRLQMAGYRAMAPGSSAVDGRITDQFAVVYAAGMLARHYGILPWSLKEIAWAVRSCERAHHQFVAQSQAQLDPITAVRSYITDNLPHFRKVPDPSITKQEFERSAGFVYIDRYGAREYPIPPGVFDREFAHLNIMRALRALGAAGLLVRTGAKYVSKVPIRSSATDGREWVYRIRGTVLNDL